MLRKPSVLFLGGAVAPAYRGEPFARSTGLEPLCGSSSAAAEGLDRTAQSSSGARNRETRGGHLPTEKSDPSLRKKIRPLEMAGEARKRSPRSFRDRSCGLRPARITKVSPVSLSR